MQQDNNLVAWTTARHVRATINADGGVLLDIKKGLCYSLNPVGARIWQTIESGGGRVTLDNIVNSLAQQFPVSREQLALDVSEYLRELQQKELTKALSNQQAIAEGSRRNEA